MTVDELDEYCAKLNLEAEELREKHNLLADRVRIQPWGQVGFYIHFLEVAGLLNLCVGFYFELH